jgi:serine phosphatase RsbU (regulator of sigma subunit)
MGAGDILLLYTDGLLEHARGSEPYFPNHLEQTIRGVRQESAKMIFETIKASVLDFAPPSDDISVVVIKRT